jgi:hypothetical protein
MGPNKPYLPESPIQDPGWKRRREEEEDLE